MFEYFIVYGRKREELEAEEVNGAEFLGQIVEESLFDMESEGFDIRRSSDEINCRLLADINLCRRVFGNIFSNLLKYADRNRPVTVSYQQRADCLIICFGNYVAEDAQEKESTGIGLKTCAKNHWGPWRKFLQRPGSRFFPDKNKPSPNHFLKASIQPPQPEYRFPIPKTTY